MTPHGHVVVGVVVPHEVLELGEALEVVPHGGEEVVGDALLGAELPCDGLHLGKVVVVHAGEQVVLDVIVEVIRVT